MKRILIMIMMMWCGVVNAQMLQLGSKLDDGIVLDTVWNYHKPSATFSELAEGKPTLLFFFGSLCSESRKYIPIMDSLQKQFSGKIKMIELTMETSTEMNAAKENHPAFSASRVPMVVGDKKMHELFYHITVPHFVWIESDGTVKAITAAKDVSKSNLEKFGAGENFSFKLKKDAASKRQYLGLDPAMLFNYDMNKDKMMQYSYLSSYRADFGASRTVERMDNGRMRITALNNTLASLYSFTYPEIYPIHKTQVLFGNTILYKPDFETMEGLYCYDLIMSTGNSDSIRRRMRYDLDQHFELTSSKERRTIPCYIVTRTGIEDKLASKATKGGKTVIGGEIRIRKETIWSLLAFTLNQLPLKVIDETGYTGFIDIMLPENTNDIQLLRKYLERYGLALQEGKREIDVIVIERLKK